MNRNKYNIDKMISLFETGEAIEFLFFWGHTRKPKEGVEKQCLSQWYRSGFKLDGVHYKTSEHWMMAQKAKLFNDLDSFEEIVKSDSPKEAKSLGRKIKNFGPDVWDEYKYKIVIDGNIQKFTQNTELFDYLKSTKGKYLVEASPNDDMWGIGISDDSNDIDNPYLWRGENLLGFALMEVRDQLDKLEYFKPLVNPELPPWIVYPEVEYGDMFWRMGGGEDYLDNYFEWYLSLTKTEQEIYKITFPVRNGWGFY